MKNKRRRIADERFLVIHPTRMWFLIWLPHIPYLCVTSLFIRQ